MFVTLQELAELTNSSLIGNPEAKISCVASIQRASNHDLVYCENEKYLSEALSSGAAAVVAGEFAASIADSPKPLLIARQPRLAFALAARRLRSCRRPGGVVHQTAIVPPTVVFGDDVVVGAHVVFGDHVTVGNRVAIGAGTCIGSNVTIGEDCEIHSRVTIYHGTTIGTHSVIHSGAVLGADGFGYVRDQESGRYHQMPQIGKLLIGDYVEIGANTTIDRGGLEDTVIGSGTKIDNLVHIGHNVRVGENVVMAAQVGVSGSTEIGAGAILAGQVGISEHVRIGEGVILGGQAGVFAHKVMREPGVPHFGTPARPLPEVMKEMATLSRITRKRE